MSKAAKARRVGDNEALAIGKMLRGSPIKLNMVAQTIRGQKVEDALTSLSFSPRKAAVDVKKVLQSAVANAENNHGLDVDSLVVAEASVGKSLVMRRFRPRARGRTGKILKPYSRIEILVREVEESA